MSRRALSLVIVMLLSILVVLVATLFGPTEWSSNAEDDRAHQGLPISEETPATSPGGRSDIPRSSASISAPGPSRERRADRCIVIDQERRPISGAELQRIPADRRYSPASSVVVLGKADSLGVLELPEQWRAEPLGFRHVMRAKGYLSRQVAQIPGGDTPNEIVLDRARTFEISCVDSSGAPVTDVGVLATRTTGDLAMALDAHSDVRWVPGPYQYSAVHLAATDGRGVARLEDLGPESYGLALQSKTHVVDAPPGSIEPGAPEKITVVFSPLWVASVEVVGDEVVGASLSVSTSPGDIHPHIAATIRQVSEQLRERFPNAHSEVGVIQNAKLSSVAFSAYLARAGVLNARVKQRLLREFTRPEVIRADAAIQPSGAIRSFDIELLDRDGRHLSPDCIGLSMHTPQGGSVRVAVNRSGPTRLPNGSFSIFTAHRFLGEALGSRELKIDEQTPNRITIRADRALRLCQIDPVTSEGWEVSNGRISLSFGGRSIMCFVHDRSGFSMVLPVGKGSIQLSALGLSSSRVPVMIDESPSEGTQTIPIEVRSNH